MASMERQIRNRIIAVLEAVDFDGAGLVPTEVEYITSNPERDHLTPPYVVVRPPIQEKELSEAGSPPTKYIEADFLIEVGITAAQDPDDECRAAVEAALETDGLTGDLADLCNVCFVASDEQLATADSAIGDVPTSYIIFRVNYQQQLGNPSAP